MSMLDKLKSLLEPVPDQNVSDQSYPQEADPEYYDDTSVGSYELPATAVLDDVWKPTADQVVPGYRGTEEHGVPYDATPMYIIPNDQATADAKEKAEHDALDAQSQEITHETIMDPIPVQVVEMPSPIGQENRLGINSYTLVRGAVAVRIAPKSHRRSKLLLSVIGTDQVNIHTDQQAASTTGYPVTAAKGDVELSTTDPVYAYAPASLATDPILYVLAETTVHIDEHPV